MFESLLIALRETLEASLVVFIVLSYLKKIEQTKFNRYVYWGVIMAILASLIVAWFFQVLAGGFEGPAEPIFEGTVMLIAAILLTTMIIWMAKAQHVRHQLEARVQVELADHHRFGLFAVTFLAVFREGVETVLFLGAIALRGAEDHNLLGAVIGIVLAVGLGYALFYGTKKMHLKTFFRVTSILLIFFAAGLLARAAHEFQEIGWLPFGTAQAWNLNPAVNPDGSFPLWHDEGTLGSILAGVFGYSAGPSILEVCTYLIYFVLAWWGYGKVSLSRRETSAVR